MARMELAALLAETHVRSKSSKVSEHFTLKNSKKTIYRKMFKAELARHENTTVIHEHLKRKNVGTIMENEQG